MCGAHVHPLLSHGQGQTCSICLEPWTSSGLHRLSSLRCGHLFGFTCIDKWLRGSGTKCPQCNVKAKRADIRMIYAKTISVVDTTERDRALQVGGVRLFSCSGGGWGESPVV